MYWIQFLFENLRLETLKQPSEHNAIFLCKLIVQEGQQCLNLAAEVSALGDELLMEFIQQLTVMNQIERQENLHELELLDRFLHHLQYVRLR